MDDIPALINVFLTKVAEENRTPAKQMTPGALALLKKYPWPGNVRELKNLVERLDIMAGQTIDTHDIPAPYSTSVEPAAPDPLGRLFAYQRLKDAQQAFEDAFILQKLETHNFDITKTARATGADKSRIKKIHQKMTKLQAPEP
jgi:two-component system nitrogen regulation response regulator NtrX